MKADKAIRAIRSQKLSRAKEDEAIKTEATDVDYFSDGSDDFDDVGVEYDVVPARKRKNFEFTDSFNIMKIIRTIMYIQIIALFSEHTSIRLPLLFTLLIKPICFYSLRWYSRPIVDFVYAMQVLLQRSGEILASMSLPSPDSNSKVQVTNGRRLYGGRKDSGMSNSDYAPRPDPSRSIQADVDFTDPANWHTIQIYMHYIFGIMFFIVAIFFTLRFWEISDFTNRVEVKNWLHDYVADGWTRRGGFQLCKSIARAYMYIAFSVYGLYLLAHSFSQDSIPDKRYLGTFFLCLLAAILVTYLAGFQFLKATESAFTRYVSQNVSYTSSIILKRVVKVKVELGIMIIIAMYTPVLYNLTQALTVVTDWNDIYAAPHRKSVNYFVPCYFLAFPPYKHREIPSDQCPVYSSNSPNLPINSGYYEDSTILPCDSYFGIGIFTLSLVSISLLILMFFVLLYKFSQEAIEEFRSSRWIAPVIALHAIRDNEVEHFEYKYLWVQRIVLDIELEIRQQIKYFFSGIKWVITVSTDIVVDVTSAVVSPVVFVLTPFAFFAYRAFALACNDCTEEGRLRLLRAKLREEEDNLSEQSYEVSIAGDISVDSAAIKIAEMQAQAQNLLDGDESSIGGNSLASGSAVQKMKKGGKQDKRNAKRKALMEKMAQYDEENVHVKSQDPFIERVLIWMYNMLWNSPCIRIPREFIVDVANKTGNAFVRSAFWALIKLYTIKALDFITCKRNDAKSDDGLTKGFNVAHVGGTHATWRNNLKILAQLRSIRNLNRRIAEELHRSKVEFIMDHQLTISIFDCVVDSAGLFSLVCQYEWDRMYWSCIIWVELTLYAIVGGAMDYYADWELKIQFYVVMIIVFGFITCLFRPYSDDSDRWLDFMGRGLVAAAGLGIIECSKMAPESWYQTAQSVSIFTPLHTFSLLVQLNLFSAIVYVAIDLCVVLYFFIYILYLLKIIGIYSVFAKKIDAIKFGMHDKVLDFLVEAIDEVKFGLENIHSALILIHQWDDIIVSQRRYALLVWPDVRPPELCPWHKKVIEIQWAAAFNLTISNLRSSLGLSLLHTTMCSAESEITRWLIINNNELLVAEDAQRDTPIIIGLKECAYFLMKFGAQNNGELDDGTSYNDESYNEYYPEIEEFRTAVIEQGEFIKEFVERYYLDSVELSSISTKGYFIESGKTVEGKYVPTFQRLQPVKRSLNDILKGQQGGVDTVAAAAKALKDAAKKRRKQAKAEADALKMEKQSLYSKRFPEDEFVEDYESGYLTSWKMIGVDVPANNLFLDLDAVPFGHSIEEGEEDIEEVETEFEKNLAEVNEDAMQEIKFDQDGKEIDVEMGIIEVKKLEVEKAFYVPDLKWSKEKNMKNANLLDKSLLKKYKTYFHKWIVNTCSSYEPTDDLEYVISSSKETIDAGAAAIPDDHPKLRELKDFDSLEAKAELSKKSIFQLLKESKFLQGSSIGDNDSLAGSEDMPTSYIVEASHDEREVRYKVCKFAEIFMSKEVAENCRSLKWDVMAFKELNKLASLQQGRIAQNLALVLNLNPPAGFTRISEWTLGVPENVFDEVEEGTISTVIKYSLELASAMDTATNIASIAAAKAVNSIKARMMPGTDYNRHKGSKRNQYEYSMADSMDGLGQNASENSYNDRIIQYFAECMVASRTRIVMDDLELSVYGRKGWRAIVRALRRTVSSYVIPTVFCGPKQIILLHLSLPRNEFDDGDCVLISDVLAYQAKLIFLDLSFNKIATRGFSRLCKVLKSHDGIVTLKLDHNRIGPASGKTIGVLLKTNKILRVLTLSHNFLGTMVRYESMLERQTMYAVTRDVFTGLKYNKGLHRLDLSYNHLGPVGIEIIPIVVNKHLTLNSLDISGNNFGDAKGTEILFSFAGRFGYRKVLEAKHAFYDELRAKAIEDAKNPNISKDSKFVARNLLEPLDSDDEKDKPLSLTDAPDKIVNKKLMTKEEKAEKKRVANKLKKLKEQEEKDGGTNACQLAELNMADNQLGCYAGYALGEMLLRNKNLTSVDMSKNNLGWKGGVAVTDAYEKILELPPRDFFKKTLAAIEELQYQGRNAKVKKRLFTNIINLNLSQNNLGPDFARGLMYCMAHPSCTLVFIDICDNPLGAFLEKAGDPVEAGIDMRLGMSESKILVSANLRNTSFFPMQLVPMFGGIARNSILRYLDFSGVRFDEPTCLQAAHALKCCKSITHISLSDCNIGPKGGILICTRIETESDHLRYLDLSKNVLGPLCSVIIQRILESPKCKIITWNLSDNEFLDGGGSLIVQGFSKNSAVRDLDLSRNALGHDSGKYLGLLCRGLYINGKKVSSCKVKRLVFNNNPDIGKRAAKDFVKGLLNAELEEVSFSNIGGGPSMGSVIAKGLRDVAQPWINLDMSNNEISRTGANEIFWAMRQNRRVRKFNFSGCAAGPKFGTDEDALLSHGISIVKAIQVNLTLRDIDLSFNGLSSNACINILEAMLDNYTVKRLSLRGNIIDDGASEKINEFFRFNTTVEELDLGANKLGFNCTFALAEGIELNRSIRTLLLDKNMLGNAGTSCIDSFTRGLLMNCNLRVFTMDGNHLGPIWGQKFAEVIARKTTLVELSLQSNFFNDQCGRILIDAFEHNIYLSELALSKDEIGLLNWDRLRAVYSSKKAFKNPSKDMQDDTQISNKALPILGLYDYKTVTYDASE